MRTFGPASASPRTGSAFSGAAPLPEAEPRLLFDEHLPPQLASRLAAHFPGSSHVIEIGLAGARDTEVWDAAERGGFILVTKDGDFEPMSVLRGHPPKVIWVRLGNAATEATVIFFEARTEIIKEFARDPEAGFLALG